MNFRYYTRTTGACLVEFRVRAKRYQTNRGFINVQNGEIPYARINRRKPIFPGSVIANHAVIKTENLEKYLPMHVIYRHRLRKLPLIMTYVYPPLYITRAVGASLIKTLILTCT